MAEPIGATSLAIQAIDLLHSRGKTQKGNERRFKPKPVVVPIHRPDRGYSLRPAQLYSQRATPHYYERYGCPGKSLGVLDQTLIFWEISGRAQNVDDKELLNMFRGDPPRTVLEILQRVRYIVVGPDKKHAHVAAMLACQNPTEWDVLMTEMTQITDDEIQSRFPGFGILILNSLPDFLPDILPESSTEWRGESSTIIGQKERYNLHSQVFLASDESHERPPCRIACLSESHDEWEITTIGGILTMPENNVYGLYIGSSSPVSKKLVPSSSFVPGQKIGDFDFDYGDNRKSNRERRVVRLSKSYLRPNIIQPPHGFGQEVALTEVGDVISNSEVWIVTARCGVFVSRVLQLSTRPGDENAHKHLWRLQAPSELEPEDCGSWVVDTATHSLIGIIARVEDGVAVFLPAKECFDFSRISLTLPAINIPSPFEAAIPKTPKLRIIFSPPAKNPSVIDTIFCCFRSKPTTGISSYQVGPVFGVADGKRLWELHGSTETEWHMLEPRIAEIVRRTPTESRFDAPPTVVLHGFLVGKKPFERDEGKDCERDEGEPDERAVPTVLITCSSKSYAAQLQKTIYQNGVLENTPFEVMILSSPIEKMNEGENREDV